MSVHRLDTFWTSRFLKVDVWIVYEHTKPLIVGAYGLKVFVIFNAFGMKNLRFCILSFT